MVSVDTMASVGATIALAEMLWPLETLKPASKLENKSNETDREAARTSEHRRRNSFGDRQKRRIQSGPTHPNGSKVPTLQCLGNVPGQMQSRIGHCAVVKRVAHRLVQCHRASVGPCPSEVRRRWRPKTPPALSGSGVYSTADKAYSRQGPLRLVKLVPYPAYKIGTK
jgi:hypothetical protein